MNLSGKQVQRAPSSGAFHEGRPAHERLRMTTLNTLTLITYLLPLILSWRHVRSFSIDSNRSLLATRLQLGESQPAGFPHARNLEDVSKTSIINVSTGAEFVSGFANIRVDIICLTAMEVSVSLSDWNSNGIELPIIVRRNITLEGDSNLPDIPVLDLQGVNGVAQLAGNVIFTISRIFFIHTREKNPTRAPGMDIFLPTPPGEISFIIATSIAIAGGVCFPPTFRDADFGSMERPDQFPGVQQKHVIVSQDGCINDTHAPAMKRCWADRGFVADVAFYGADINILTGSTTPNNQALWIRNLTGVCESLVDDYCLNVLRQEALVCFTEALNKYYHERGAAAGNGTLASSLVSQQVEEVQVSTMQSAGSAGNTLRGGMLAAVICGTTAGALLVAGAVLAAVWVHARHRRRHRRMWTAPDSDGAAGGGAIGDYSDSSAAPSRQLPKAACVVVNNPAASAEGSTTTAIPVVEDGNDHLMMINDPPTNELVQQAGSRATVVDLTSSTRVADMAEAPPRSRHMDLAVVTPHTPPRPDIHLNVQLVPLRAPPPPMLQQKQQQQGPSGGDGAAGNGVGNNAPADDDDNSSAPQQLGGMLGKEEQVGSGTHSISSGGSASATSESSLAKVELLPVVLGKGTFGRVVQGLYDGRRVAVKLLVAGEGPCLGGGANHHQPPLPLPAEEEEEKQKQVVVQQEDVFTSRSSLVQSFVHEVQVLSRCQHPNVVQLLAACIAPPRLCLVMELMEGSLERLLYGNPSGSIMPLEKVLRIGIGVASALAYLHPTVVHRDLKPANVLINDASSDRPVVKISDFGLSRLRLTVKSTTHPDAGTPPYMAPECFDITNTCISHQSDIYSLGVLLWEMLGGKRPWNGIRHVAIAFMVTYKGVRLPLDGLLPSRCPHKLSRLIKACWEADPSRRPAAAEVAKELTLLLEQIRHSPPQESDMRQVIE